MSDHNAKELYLEMINSVERLHRLIFDVIKCELDRDGIRDINNIQAFIIYQIGDLEISIGELTQRGYYLGSNASYNLRKMVQMGYIEQFPSPHDRRSFHIRLSDKGMKLHGMLDNAFNEQANHVKQNVLPVHDIKNLQESLVKIESFWRDQATIGRFA